MRDRAGPGPAAGSGRPRGAAPAERGDARRAAWGGCREAREPPGGRVGAARPGRDAARQQA